MPTQCNNCGRVGHVFKTCVEPITSIGIVAYFVTSDNKIMFLNVNRRYSLSFGEFVRGTYIYIDTSDDPRTYRLDTEYAKTLFKNMSTNERKMISKLSFSELWNKWSPRSGAPKNNQSNHRMYAKEKYHAFKRGIVVDGVTHSLRMVSDATTAMYDLPEWGFPKGRRNRQENDIDCAKREFEEETGFGPHNLRIVDPKPIYEEYRGFNNVMYKNKYFVSEFVSSDMADYRLYQNLMHKRARGNPEIRCVRWMDYRTSVENLRPYHGRRKDVLKIVHNSVMRALYSPPPASVYAPDALVRGLLTNINLF